MPMPRRGARWIWAGRIAAAMVLAGLVIYLVRAGLDTADKLGSSISVVVAVAALLSPYLLPVQKRSDFGERSPREDPPVSSPTLGSEMDFGNAKGVQTTQDVGRRTQSNTGGAADAKVQASKYSVDARGAQGVQIGDQGHQTNTLGVASPTPHAGQRSARRDTNP
jgi:hypothetical protein